MRAAVLDQLGPNVPFRMAELPTPEPGPGQVRVRLEAVGVNPAATSTWFGLVLPTISARPFPADTRLGCRRCHRRGRRRGHRMLDGQRHDVFQRAAGDTGRHVRRAHRARLRRRREAACGIVLLTYGASGADYDLSGLKRLVAWRDGR